MGGFFSSFDKSSSKADIDMALGKAKQLVSSNPVFIFSYPKCCDYCWTNGVACYGEEYTICSKAENKGHLVQKFEEKNGKSPISVLATANPGLKFETKVAIDDIKKSESKTHEADVEN